MLALLFAIVIFSDLVVIIKNVLKNEKQWLFIFSERQRYYVKAYILKSEIGTSEFSKTGVPG